MQVIKYFSTLGVYGSLCWVPFVFMTFACIGCLICSFSQSVLLNQGSLTQIRWRATLGQKLNVGAAHTWNTSKFVEGPLSCSYALLDKSVILLGTVFADKLPGNTLEKLLFVVTENFWGFHRAIFYKLTIAERPRSACYLVFLFLFCVLVFFFLELVADHITHARTILGSFVNILKHWSNLLKISFQFLNNFILRFSRDSLLHFLMYSLVMSVPVLLVQLKWFCYIFDTKFCH